MVIEVGGWEHACCGDAFELNAVVDVQFIRYVGEDGRERLSESHHFSDEELGANGRHIERLHGRAVALHVVMDDGSIQPIRRIPSGSALTGNDESDDGHLEEAWSGNVIEAESDEFIVTVRP